MLATRTRSVEPIVRRTGRILQSAKTRIEAVRPYLHGLLRPGDLVLLKDSDRERLETIMATRRPHPPFFSACKEGVSC
jgi:hypothetical protein